MVLLRTCNGNDVARAPVREHERHHHVGSSGGSGRTKRPLNTRPVEEAAYARAVDDATHVRRGSGDANEAERAGAPCALDRVQRTQPLLEGGARQGLYRRKRAPRRVARDLHFDTDHRRA